MARNKQTNKKIVPIKTWSPWKPVATKNVVPNTLSLIENDLLMYSNNWKQVKIRPKNKVTIIILKIFLLFWILWCAHVTLTPEDKRIAVFNKGTLKGFKGLISTGGQTIPISWTGDKLLWKKDQNQAIKNKTSLKINKIIPHFKPSWTFKVWSPNKPLSREISRHQNKENKTNIKTLI